MSGLLITFSGPDGVGKSTQAALVVKRLQRHGYRARSFWFRPGYSRELDAARALVRRLRPGVLPPRGESEARARAFARLGVREAWLALASLDAAIQLGVKVRTWLACGDIVVCDRYLRDTALDLRLKFPESSKTVDGLISCLELVCPSPALSFALHVPSEEAELRLAGKQEPFPEAAPAREVRRAAYERLAGAAGARIVRADAPVEIVHEEIWARVLEVLQ